jgi:hypothetical protein
MISGATSVSRTTSAIAASLATTAADETSDLRTEHTGLPTATPVAGDQRQNLNPAMRPDHARERTPERIAAAEAGILHAVFQCLSV